MTQLVRQDNSQRENIHATSARTITGQGEKATFAYSLESPTACVIAVLNFDCTSDEFTVAPAKSDCNFSLAVNRASVERTGVASDQEKQKDRGTAKAKERTGPAAVRVLLPFHE